MALSKKPKLKMFCTQGETFRHTFYFQDEYGNYADLTGFTARMEIRSSDDDLLIRLETGDGITIEGKKMTVEIDATTTAGFATATYSYEPELIAPSGDVIKYFAPSPFVVLPEVTL